jgi:hypothetical protein
LSLTKYALQKGIKIKHSANYYPQGNGLAESTNKNILKIIKKTISDNHKNWHKALIYALWEDRITYKASLGTSPYFLVYGKEVILPPNISIPSLALVQSIEEQPCSSLQYRTNQIFKLEEVRDKAKNTFSNHQMIIKKWFDNRSVGEIFFEVGDLVLKWDKAHEEKGKHTKFQKLWLGPFQVAKKLAHLPLFYKLLKA